MPDVSGAFELRRVGLSSRLSNGEKSNHTKRERREGETADACLDAYDEARRGVFIHKHEL